MTSSTLIPEDDLLLNDSIEVSQGSPVSQPGASLDALAKGNTMIPDKRKGGSFFIQYYRARRRINSESINSHGLSFFDRCKHFQDHATLNREAWAGDLMLGDCHANCLTSPADMIDKSADVSMREDGSHKLTENICPSLGNNVMVFFEVDIDPKDDTHMHKSDSDNSSSVTEVEYASLPDSLLSFSNKDYILCSLNTEDSIDDILMSPLLDSPENVLEDTSFHDHQEDVCHCETDVKLSSILHLDPFQLSEEKNICSLNTEDSVVDILNSPLLDSPEKVLDDTSFHDHQEDVCRCEIDVKLSSISHLDPFQLNEEKNICNLNTEDPEIPCNESNFLLSHPSPTFPSQIVTDSIDPVSSCSQSQMDSPNLSSEFDSAHPRVGYALKSVSLDHNPSMSNHKNSDSDSDLPCFPDIVGPYLSSEFDSAHPHVGYALESVSLDHNPSMSNHNSSDSDSDLPCLPDIEALIIKLDFEYAQESWITNDVKSHKYVCDKRTINRLETSSLQRAMSSLGAFAVFYSRQCNYYIKKTEVTVGRSTADNDVDIDLIKESRANMISRQQATIKMETDGTFTLKNTGKGSILMNGISVAHGQVAALSSSCFIQIRGMDFMFEINERYVKWYLDNIIMKGQGKYTTFEWSSPVGDL